jgi:hypothetical protein
MVWNGPSFVLGSVLLVLGVSPILYFLTAGGPVLLLLAGVFNIALGGFWFEEVFVRPALAQTRRRA